MDSNSESDITDSEIDEYKEKPHSLLKDGILKVKRSDGSLKCPFCPGKKKQVYYYQDLLQHARGIGTSSSSKRKAKAKAKHLALAAYLNEEYDVQKRQKRLQLASLEQEDQADENVLRLVEEQQASPLQLVGRQVYVEERRPSCSNISSSTMSCGGGNVKKFEAEWVKRINDWIIKAVSKCVIWE